ncbi:MAG: hypothetical protein RLY14_850 [Planctomycetota bacterium]|jgi:type II secretory pathway pseudopilin PulG
MTSLIKLITLLDYQIPDREPQRTKGLRHGSTLIELLAAMVTGTILIAGMTTSVMLSQQSLSIVTNGYNKNNSQRQALNQLRTDLREATALDITNPSVWNLTVPDRNNDGSSESIQYRLPSTDSKTVSRTAWSLDTNYPTNDLRHTMLAKPALPLIPSGNPTVTSPTGEVVIEGISANFCAPNKSLIVSCPGTSNVNEMQIAIFAVNKFPEVLNVTGTGWQNLFLGNSNNLSIGMWMRIVNNDSSNIEFTSNGNNRLSACVIRVSGHNNQIAFDPPKFYNSASPISLGRTTTVANSLHFRVLIANGSNYIANYTGLSQNNCLVMSSGDGTVQAVTLGIGSQWIETPSTPPTMNFSLTRTSNALTFSFVIPPFQGQPTP